MSKSAKIDDALKTIASAFSRTIQPGEITGTLIEQGGELEIEVTLRITRRVSMTDAGRIRARAMTMLATEPWRDNCPATVKNRGSWAISKHKGCSNKVSVVVVCSGYEDMSGPLRDDEHRRQVPTERFHFVCSHHAEATGPDVLAVVRLEAVALRTLRAKLQREADEKIARERQQLTKLEDEVRTLSDGDLSGRLAEFVAAHSWGSEDVCLREQRRRERDRRNSKPDARPVSTTENL